MSTFLKITSLTKSILFLSLLLVSYLQTVKSGEAIPLLYLGSHVTKCRTVSPENFYRDIAFPTLANLHEEANGFFGILMDKLEASVADEEKEEQTNLEKKWLYLMETIQNSLESVIQRIQTSWGILVSIHDTEALPWETSIKGQMAGEFLNEIGYQYAMVEAVVKAGVKEIVGTLQLQLAQVIQKLEKDVSKFTKDGEDVTEIKLLRKMDKSLKKMKPNFVGNLLKKIVERAIASRTPEGALKALYGLGHWHGFRHGIGQADAFKLRIRIVFGLGIGLTSDSEFAVCVYTSALNTNFGSAFGFP